MIPTLENLEELQESNDILGDSSALQSRMEEYGYLFFRRLQDVEMLKELRRQMLTTMQECGWIKQGTDPVDGIAEPGVQCTEGDTLLLQTGNDFVSTYRNSKDFYLVSSVEGLETRHHQKARTALLLLICLLAWLILGSLFQSTDSPLGLNSPAVASLAIAVLMVLTRCLKPSDARNAINLQVLLTIAAALGLGKALSASGAAEALAHSLISTGGTNPIWLLIAIYLITVGLTETISNNAVAAMLLPLAIEIAEVADINARPLIIAITLAASLSFITPIGYQTNLMVMGPGGYRSRDYLKCGIPLALLMGVSALIIIPLVWPFSV